MNNNEPTQISYSLNFINDTYDKLSYFDLYGNSVILFIFITLFVFVVFSYCKIMETKQTIADDWSNQRCKPQNMLFAGLITHPEGTTAFQYTSDNFQYCVQNILTNISGYALQPFQYMISSLTQSFSAMSNSIQQTRGVISKLRNNFKSFAEDILSRILNVIIPIQKMMIALMDTFQKIQGTMTAGLYTMLGSYYTLQALMGAILEMIVKMLTALVIIIVGLWVMPFTWPAAASMSAVFLAIAIPLSIVTYFMTEVLHIKTSAIPKLRCFDGATLLPLFSGEKVPIKDVALGAKLADGSHVTAKMKVTTEGLKIFKLHNIIVSECHLVKYHDKWVRVGYHPEAIQIPYDKPYLYCLNTSNKRIHLEGIEFSDWDEIVDNITNIHEYFDDGFNGHTLIRKSNKESVRIKQVKIGDILENGSVVYGLVEIDARKLRKYSGNIRTNKLYHLLTNDGNLFIDSINVKDYNNVLDKFII